jgi:hypothetical protein
LVRTAATRWRARSLVVERDHRAVVLDDRAGGVERGLHHLLGRERPAQHRRGLEEPLVLVLGALDRAEHLLGGDRADDLLRGVGHQLDRAGVEAHLVLVGAQHAAQVRALEHRHRHHRGAVGDAGVVVVRQLAALGRHHHRGAIAHHRAEQAGRRQRVGRRPDRRESEITSLSLSRSPSPHQASTTVRAPERALDRGQDPRGRVVDQRHAAGGQQALLVVAGPGRAAGRAQRGGDQPVVAGALVHRVELAGQAQLAAAAVAGDQPAQEQGVGGGGGDHEHDVEHDRRDQPRAARGPRDPRRLDRGRRERS